MTMLTAAWDEGNMIQAMARMKNPTIAWRLKKKHGGGPGGRWFQSESKADKPACDRN